MLAILIAATLLQAEEPKLRNVYARARGPLDLAVAQVFEVDRWRIIAPEWFREVRVDLAGESRAQLRDKLIERYSLVWHRERRMEPVWVVRRGATSPPEGDPRQFRGFPRFSSGPSWTHVVCDPCQIQPILRLLSISLQATVEDETGLGGWYKFKLLWETGNSDDMIRAWRGEANLDLVQEFREVEVVVIDAAVRPDPPPDPPRFACEATPDIRAAIDALPPMDDFAFSYEERMAPRRKLAAGNGYDVFAQMAIQDAFRAGPPFSRDWHDALAAYRKLDHSFLGPFLEARLRLSLDRQRSREILESVLHRAPDFPWAHLALAEWVERHAPNDAALAERHIVAFRKLCPKSPAVYSAIGAVRNPELLGEMDRTLAFDAPAELKPRVWDVMRRIHREAAPALIGRDLALFRFRPRTLAWAKALWHGYSMSGDQAGLRWIAHIIRATWPQSGVGRELASRM